MNILNFKFIATKYDRIIFIKFLITNQSAKYCAVREKGLFDYNYA